MFEGITFTDLLFYLFSGLLMLGAVMAITVRNSVYAVLYLIFCFFNAAALYVMIGAEFLAMLLVIVYVGAVAILFLFVVMMLNAPAPEQGLSWKRYYPVALGLGVILLAEIGFLIFYHQGNYSNLMLALPHAASANAVTNTQAIGLQLYTDYFYAFQLAGLILFVAMVAVIALTLKEKAGNKRQDIGMQVRRNPAECVTLVRVETGEGVK